jgi:hypothetical protein
MIPLLIQRIVTATGRTKEQVALDMLTADPFDLILHMEQVWDLTRPWGTQPAAGGARRALWAQGDFAPFAPTDFPAWDHLGYSYVLENTRIIQILRRVVHLFRSGESLGVPKIETQQWLDATETILFGASNPIPSWLSTSSVRPDPEAVRRNAYQRLFELGLAFGDDQDRPAVFERAAAANTGFVRLFEELLFELWKAMTNINNSSGEDQSDDDRIYRLAEELGYVLRSRRQNKLIAREELSAATALGWAELTVSTNNPIITDLGASATNPASRLQLIGERVGLPAHGKSAAFFSMAESLSKFLYAIEGSVVTGPENAWILYLEKNPVGGTGTPIGAESRRVITEWAAATGKDLKARSRAVQTEQRPRLVAVR